MKHTRILFVLAVMLLLLWSCTPQAQTITATTSVPSATPIPTLTATVIPPTPIPTPTPGPTSTPAYTPTPLGQLFFDDFEGDTKDYFGFGLDNDKWGVMQIEDNNVLFVKPVPNTSGGIFLFFGYLPTNDYAITFDFMLSGTPGKSDAWFSIVLRAEGGRRYASPGIDFWRVSKQYQCFWDLGHGKTAITHEEFSISTTLTDFERLVQQDRRIQPNRWYHIRAEISDDLITWYIDDKRWLSASDSRISTGKAGFSFGEGTNADFYFDNILIESLE